MCDITDEEFERLYLPVCINYDNYLKEFVIPDVILISNHINAGGGDSHCVTNIKYNN